MSDPEFKDGHYEVDKGPVSVTLLNSIQFWVHVFIKREWLLQENWVPLCTDLEKNLMNDLIGILELHTLHITQHLKWKDTSKPKPTNLQQIMMQSNFYLNHFFIYTNQQLLFNFIKMYGPHGFRERF